MGEGTTRDVIFIEVLLCQFCFHYFYLALNAAFISMLKIFEMDEEMNLLPICPWC